MNHLTLLAAARFAVIAHGRQVRKYTGEPYIAHPLAVAAAYMAAEREDFVGGAAAILHDVVEDTPVTEAEVRELFGDDVGDLVMEVTNASKPEDGNRAARKAIDREHLAKASYKGKTIKLADVIDNLKSIMQHDPHFAKIYMTEKRELLPLLKGGNADLFRELSALIESYFHLNGE
jgi:(p)ppGpp synthase/HD superfamily hydrolase